MQKRDKGLQNYAHISLKNVCLTTIVPFRFLSLFYVCVWKLHIIFCAPFARVSNNVFEWSYFIVECFIVAMYYVQRKKTTRAMIFSITLRFHFHQRKQIITIWTQKRREFRYAFLFLLFLRIFSFYFSTWISVEKFFLCKLFWILLLWNLLMIISFSFACISLNVDRLYAEDRE